MVDYHREEVAWELVSYIEKYHPEVLFMVRPDDTAENRKMGKRPGFPDVLVLEIRGRYIGLAMWITRKLTDHEIRQRERFARSGHEVEMSDDWDDLRLIFMEYISGFPNTDRVDKNQLRLIRASNHKGYRESERTPLTHLDYDTLRGVESYVRKKYRRAAIIPSFGSECGPDLTIIAPNSTHIGLAIWLSDTDRCYSFFNLTYRQIDCLKTMAKRLYITIASSDYQDITDIIDFYMIDMYERGKHLPKFCDEDCP